MLEYHIFHRYSDRKKAVLQKIEDFCRTITKLTGALAANICERNLLSPLALRPLGSFLWPLGKSMANAEPKNIDEASPMERRTANTFRQKYLDNDYLVRPNEVVEPSVMPTDEMAGETV
jgi:hypothetical protein